MGSQTIMALGLIRYRYYALQKEIFLWNCLKHGMWSNHKDVQDSVSAQSNGDLRMPHSSAVGWFTLYILLKVNLHLFS